MPEDVLSGTQIRLYVVGGAGSLYVDPDHATILADTPDFPDAFRPLAHAQARQLEALRDRDDVHWVYVSPAAEFDPYTPATGRYGLAGEELTFNEEGRSYITYGDYAAALVEQIITGKRDRERISIFGL